MPENFIDLPINSSTLKPKRAIEITEALFVDLEAQVKARVTFHDRSGIFSSSKGQPFLKAERGWHTHPACSNRDDSRPVMECLDHCKRDVNRRAKDSSSPFAHRCWRALEEVVVPVWKGDAHIGTLFAGPFRFTGARSADPNPAKASEREKLEELNAGERLRIARVLLHGADALMATHERLVGLHTPQSLSDIIRHALRYRVHQGLTLDDLASDLGLSSSQCSRVVEREMGQPFSELLREERLQRAMHLMRTTRWSLADIVEAVGWQSQHHFNRSFSKRFGMSPGAWRKAN